jgi:hypothetical protein
MLWAGAICLDSLISCTPCRIREECKRNRLVNEARVFQQKLALVQEVRYESREIDKVIAAQRLHHRRTALERKDEVKSGLGSVTSAKQREEERKRDMAKETYEERLQREIVARQAQEEELRRMTKLEQEMIERLKCRQQEQDQVHPASSANSTCKESNVKNGCAAHAS